MDCKYKLSEKEVVQAMQLHAKGSKKVQLILVLVGIAILLAGILGTDKFRFISFFAVASGFIGYFFTLKIVTPYRAKKQFREYKALRLEVSIALSDQGIIFSSDSGEGKLAWEDILKWKCNDDICLLYIASNLFHMIPLRTLSNDNSKEKLFALLNEYRSDKKA